jgi:hypothetical protein
VAARRALEFPCRDIPQNYFLRRSLDLLARADFCSSAVAFSIASIESFNSHISRRLAGDANKAIFFTDGNFIK